MKIAVIIPSLNEAGNVRQVITDIPREAGDQVLIIVADNGSTDNTAEIARSCGALVVSEPRRGYGFACQRGLESALPEAPEALVFLDGDYSFVPAEMTRLLKPIRDGSADMVIGSRLNGAMEAGAMPPHAQFGNWLVSRLMRWLYGLHITDLGPYRAIRSESLLSLHMREMTYGWPTEMLVKAARSSCRIVEVPVSYRQRLAGRSKVSGTVRGTLLATYYILGLTLRYAWARGR